MKLREGLRGPLWAGGFQVLFPDPGDSGSADAEGLGPVEMVMATGGKEEQREADHVQQRDEPEHQPEPTPLGRTEPAAKRP